MRVSLVDKEHPFLLFCSQALSDLDPKMALEWEVCLVLPSEVPAALQAQDGLACPCSFTHATGTEKASELTALINEFDDITHT